MRLAFGPVAGAAAAAGAGGGRRRGGCRRCGGGAAGAGSAAATRLAGLSKTRFRALSFENTWYGTRLARRTSTRARLRPSARARLVTRSDSTSLVPTLIRAGICEASTSGMSMTSVRGSGL